MGGGLLQLVAYGAQDVYLTGNPQITFFKVVYRRHTNFALESIQQTFNGSVGWGNRVTATISRNGDLISRAYLEMKVTGGTTLVPMVGLKAVKYVELEIGGQKIDKHYGEWMYIWNELSMPVGKKQAYYNMVGGKGMANASTMYVPLEFWFCRNVGLALPLIGLQYHEVKVNIQFAPDSEVADAAATAGKLECSLWVDYVYLDTDERRKFAQSSHEYLIEQLQFTGKEQANRKIKLNFNHPVKELIWVAEDSSKIPRNWMNFSNNLAILSTPSSGTHPLTDNNYETISNLLGNQGTTKNLITKAKLTLNGNDRFAVRDGMYFSTIQPFQHHENVPNNVGINLYSFALKPEEHQPSGTLNMSRIDSATLDLEYAAEANSTAADMVSVYAVNYNVLRILSGMGGIAYSN